MPDVWLKVQHGPDTGREWRVEDELVVGGGSQVDQYISPGGGGQAPAGGGSLPFTGWTILPLVLVGTTLVLGSLALRHRAGSHQAS